jgi:DUF4097 and DUF4098 domain-containing protein YvlB
MKAFVYLAAAAACIGFASASASAGDFQKSYSLAPGSSIAVSNMSGNVTVTGHDGNEVVVTGTVTGRDADRVEIEDRSGPGAVDVGVRYPRNCNCDASVDFVVRVPSGTGFRFDKIASMSGNVEIRDVSGTIEATAMSGDVRVENVVGTVEATAMSGDVWVDIDRLEGTGALTFTSMSGNVEVRLPADLDADVEMKTASGRISTDFPIEVREQKYGPGASASGRLGSGSRSLRIRSMSGEARLLRQ